MFELIKMYNLKLMAATWQFYTLPRFQSFVTPVPTFEMLLSSDSKQTNIYHVIVNIGFVVFCVLL